MKQTNHLRLAATRSLFPWELTDETRRVGKQGLARVRAILDAKIDGPAQQALELDFSSNITALPSVAPRRQRTLAA